jgi:hypothetical protein
MTSGAFRLARAAADGRRPPPVGAGRDPLPPRRPPPAATRTCTAARSGSAAKGQDAETVKISHQAARSLDRAYSWALIHMIGEYAGHTGRADLIRERIDWRAGWW